MRYIAFKSCRERKSNLVVAAKEVRSGGKKKKWKRLVCDVCKIAEELGIRTHHFATIQDVLYWDLRRNKNIEIVEGPTPCALVIKAINCVQRQRLENVCSKLCQITFDFPIPLEL